MTAGRSVRVEVTVPGAGLGGAPLRLTGALDPAAGEWELTTHLFDVSPRLLALYVGEDADEVAPAPEPAYTHTEPLIDPAGRAVGAVRADHPLDDWARTPLTDLAGALWWEAEQARREHRRRSEALRDLPLEDLGLPARIYNMLLRDGVRTVGDVMRMSAAELLDLRNMGERSLAEIQTRLALLHARRDGGTP